jgi:S1-C subfamily serine protease
MRVSVLLVAISTLATPLAACSTTATLYARDFNQAVTPPREARYIDTGTAFFISADGVLLTAEHVVRRCLRVDLLSEALTPTAASIIASDREADLALLRITSDTPPPAVLRIAAMPPQRSEPVKAYGYPTSTDMRRAAAIDAKLADGQIPAKWRTLAADPSAIVVLNGRVEHGYSGGPVIDGDGAVIGVTVRKSTDPKLDLFVAVGPKTLASMTAKIEVKPPAAPIQVAAGDDGKAVRPAIVRVICWSATTPPLGEN